MHDVLTNITYSQIGCLDHGYVRLVDVMPRLVPEETKTADFAIVQAARVSYGDGTKKVSEDKGLIRYLMRHRHTTPLEMVEFKFHCAMPLFVARQIIRHRMCSVNEYSARYSIVPDTFYIPQPDQIRQQSATNKQSSEGAMPDIEAQWFHDQIKNLSHEAYEVYEHALEAGVGREQARMVLPLNAYTYWYWKIDLHNLLHFLSLRCDSHAQQETREYGEAMLKLVEPVVPWTIEAWNDYHPLRNAELFTHLEIEALKEWIANRKLVLPPLVPDIKSNNSREQKEWAAKAKKLGFE